MTSTDQCPQPDLRIYMDTLKVGEKRGGRKADDCSCQEGLLADSVLGSSDLWQQTQKSLFLSANVFGNKEESGGGEILCFILTVVLPGRETMHVYFCKVSLSNAWGCGRYYRTSCI